MLITAALYRLAIAFWTGGVAVVTFVITPAIFRSQGRDSAARIVGAIFPGYFRWGLACGIVAMICTLVARTGNFLFISSILSIMIILTSVQNFYVEPRAAALKKRIPSFESTAREHPLRREFTRLHAFSAVCNLMVLACGIVLVILL